MFIKINPTTDSQLSNKDVANLIVSDALRKISQLTGLNEQQAYSLLSNQVNPHNNNNVTSNKITVPLLNHSEYQFISNLFS